MAKKEIRTDLWVYDLLKQAKINFEDQNNMPDYEFMEAYIKEKEKIKREEYLDYCQQQLKIIGGGTI